MNAILQYLGCCNAIILKIISIKIGALKVNNDFYLNVFFSSVKMFNLPGIDLK